MYEFPYYQVKDIMTRNPVTIGKRVSMALVLDVFDKYDLDAFPVVDNEGKLVGMITKLDILKAFSFQKDPKISRDKNILKHEVNEFMTKNFYPLAPDTLLAEVLQKIVNTGEMSFPVVKDDRVIGMLWGRDVIRSISQMMANKSHQSHYLHHRKKVIAGSDFEVFPKPIAQAMGPLAPHPEASLL